MSGKAKGKKQTTVRRKKIVKDTYIPAEIYEQGRIEARTTINQLIKNVPHSSLSDAIVAFQSGFNREFNETGKAYRP